MTSEREQEDSVSNPFLNFVGLWQNYWNEMNRNFYENAVRTNEQWLKAIWYPWLKAGNPQRKEKTKVE